ncbi:hypothetical protein HCJ94_17380 [Micromonospora sp. HSS6-12]|uniref:DNA-binding protein n=2 Tax=Micromonospora thermarum TaxID=2720024 RepID=A0ABX0ZBP4_9ACTN|nr:hypothetical protein [Micromonospora thermarum]
MRSQRWRARVTFMHPGNLDDEQLAALTQALPGYGILHDNGTDRMRAEMDVDAPSARLACDAAVRALRAAHAQVVGGPVTITGLRVLTAADHERELAYPPALDLVGTAEVAQMLGVSTQRAGELARTNPAFPAPVATLKMGPVWTRASIEAFDRGWERRSGRPPKTA